MPTKRRPLKHAPRIGEVRVTSRMLNVYRTHQDEIRAHGRSQESVAANYKASCRSLLNQMPWEDGDVHDLHYHQLHALAYPDPKTRPERLDADLDTIR